MEESRLAAAFSQVDALPSQARPATIVDCNSNIREGDTNGMVMDDAEMSPKQPLSKTSRANLQEN